LNSNRPSAAIMQIYRPAGSHLPVAAVACGNELREPFRLVPIITKRHDLSRPS
jgi:hypothetical protein